MTGQVFYRKWRPQTLAEVVGQEHVTRTLLNALKNGRVSHAYLFCGPRGTGKTSTGRILAKAVNCQTTKGKGEPCNTCAMCQAITSGRSMDIIEIDAASNTGVDDIRALRERVNYAPGLASRKVYIIDEVHMLSNSASNALLKTLEEPPPSIIFILATTEAHKVLPTIISRCQRFDFRRIPQADIISKLSRICDTEGIKTKPEALRLITRSVSGSLRDAENLLEQLTTYYGASTGLDQVRSLLGISGDERSKELARHIIMSDISAGIKTLNAVSNDGLDLKQFSRELVGYLRQLLLIKTGSEEALDLTAEEIAELKSLADKASMSQILKAVKSFSQLELEFNSNSSLSLELALVDLSLTAAEERDIPTARARPIPRKPAKASIPAIKAKPGKAKTAESPSSKQAEPVTTTPQATPGKAGPAEPPPPEQAEAAATTARTKPDSPMEQLKLNWGSVIEQAPEDTKRTAALAILRSAGVVPVKFEDNTVTLSFRYSYHKQKIDEPVNMRITTEILSSFLGHPCQINCILATEDNHLVEEAQKLGAQIIDVEAK